MKLNIVLLVIITFAFIGCSKEATEAANSSGFSAGDINGTWKETTTGFVIRISGVTSSYNGKGVIVSGGTAFPSSAVGGTAMTEVEHQSGGYWDAYNHTYYPTGGGTWVQAGIVGLALNSAKTEFKTGTKVYKRQ